MRKPHEDDDFEHRFWEHAETLLDRPGVSRSTMMGLPCLRLNGAFFASFDRRTGDLLVKLPATRVDALVASGAAHSFAPAGRRFREWAAIAPADEPTWADLIDEGFDHVGSLPPPTPKPKANRTR
ncbi:MAG: hypothetical protein AB7V43_04105 [Acidimicrobiia bacterium]